MAAICGLAGLAVVYRIAGTVTTLTGVTSPLLGEISAHRRRAEMRFGLPGWHGSKPIPPPRRCSPGVQTRRQKPGAHRPRPGARRAGSILTAPVRRGRQPRAEFSDDARFMIDAYGRNRRGTPPSMQRQARVNAALDDVKKGPARYRMRLETLASYRERGSRRKFKSSWRGYHRRHRRISGRDGM